MKTGYAKRGRLKPLSYRLKGMLLNGNKMRSVRPDAESKKRRGSLVRRRSSNNEKPNV